MSAQETITQAVESARRQRGLSRAELARTLGVDRGWVTLKLNRHRGWRVEDLDLLAARLGMPAAAFLVPAAPDEMRAWRDSNPQPSDAKVVPTAIKQLPARRLTGILGGLRAA